METAREVRMHAAAVPDCLGVRRRRMGAAGDESVLELKTECTHCASFEFALRERTGRLASFQAPGFVQVRRVERTSGTRALAIVSDAIDGARLSDIIRTVATSDRGIPPAWCGLVVTQLATALAALHATDPDVAHAALTPDRIIVTPASDALISDYVLGSAIELLGYSGRQYWHDLGVPVPGTPRRLDQGLDLQQLGFVALALFLGRPLDEEALEPDILRRLASSCPSPPHTDPSRVRTWMARLLGLESPFRTATDAASDARSVLGPCDSTVVSIEPLLRPLIAIDSVSGTVDRTAQGDPTPLGAPREETRPASEPTALESAAPETVTAPTAFAESIDSGLDLENPGAEPDRPAATVTAASAPIRIPVFAPEWTAAERSTATDHADAFDLPPAEAVREHEVAVPPVAIAPRRISAAHRYRSLAAAIAVAAALIGGIVLRASVVRRAAPAGAPTPAVQRLPTPPTVAPQRAVTPPVATPATGSLVVRTVPSGSTVSIDGASRGRSPVTLDLAAGEHTVMVASEGSAFKTTVVVQQGTSTSLVVPLTATTAPAVGGWISLASPFETQVFEGDQLVGSSASARLMMTAGTHTIELINTELGYRARRVVQVTGGHVVPITIDAPKSVLAINAQPWADVWLDGERIGPTPLGKVSVPIGTHDLVFRHPTLGERHHTVVVSLKTATRISVDMTAR